MMVFAHHNRTNERCNTKYRQTRGVQWIRVLWANKLSATDILLELCPLYGQNTINKGVVRHSVRHFRDERTNIHD